MRTYLKRSLLVVILALFANTFLYGGVLSSIAECIDNDTKLNKLTPEEATLDKALSIALMLKQLSLASEELTQEQIKAVIALGLGQSTPTDVNKILQKLQDIIVESDGTNRDFELTISFNTNLVKTIKETITNLKMVSSPEFKVEPVNMSSIFRSSKKFDISLNGKIVTVEIDKDLNNDKSYEEKVKSLIRVALEERENVKSNEVFRVKYTDPDPNKGMDMQVKIIEIRLK